MKGKLLISIAAVGFFFCLAFTVSAQKNKNLASYHAHKTECMGVEMDGSQTVKAWGTGRNRFDAVEQAKKTAVRDVLFNGITAGRQECQVRPVLGEVNVLEKNEAYFNKFFADGGDFKDYISLKDERIEHKILRDKQKAGDQVTRSVIARVDRPGLIEKMKQDGILK
jgi:hypothetical protein